MKTLGFSAHCATMFAGMMLGLFFSGSFFIHSHVAQASLGGDIVCLVFTELGGIGTPIPVLDGGSCPDDATPTEPENTQALCSDGLDNDGDGLIDLADPDCAAFVPPPAPTDLCPNIDGVQEAVPEGYELDGEGNCVEQATGDTGDSGDTGDTGEEDGDTDTGGGEDDSNPPPSNTGGGSPSPSSGSSSGGGGNGVIGGPLSVGYQVGGGEVLGTTTVAEVAAPAEASCGPYLNSYLRRGKQNDSAEVKKLQTFLNEHMASGLPVTGYFGPLTDAAVRAFQLKYAGEILAPWVPFGLQSNQTATGYVYKTTLRKINNLTCAALNLPIPPLP
ncbi:peptidoglycan-binding protein [Patescibacteria group bacterium]|nr:peptidoglycan-binding protein [Patescibacteria group bacterium]